MSALLWFDAHDELLFPNLAEMNIQADGLFAAGGNLQPNSLINAYRSGCFPWFSEQQPILWWCPDPRMVLKPADLHLSKSLKKHLRKHSYQLSVNQDFKTVINLCAQTRAEQGTWITKSMQKAYQKLHTLGFAHSVELYQNQELIGGLYGIALGKVFFGESMFSLRTNASKIAFSGFVLYLYRLGFELIDCQLETAYLSSLGASNISRQIFLQQLQEQMRKDSSQSHFQWQCPDVSSFIHENT